MFRQSSKTVGCQEQSFLDETTRRGLVKDRQRRRQQGWRTSPSTVVTGKAQPCRWYPVQDDQIFHDLALSQNDVRAFLLNVLGWSHYDDCDEPSLDLLNKLIVSMLMSVPFHNLTLLVRPRRPPTPVSAPTKCYYLFWERLDPDNLSLVSVKRLS